MILTRPYSRSLGARGRCRVWEGLRRSGEKKVRFKTKGKVDTRKVRTRRGHGIFPSVPRRDRREDVGLDPSGEEPEL